MCVVAVCDCKERWKNLRAWYSRYLKTAKLPSGSGTRRKKPYYLAEFLSFLEPFTKSRKQSGNLGGDSTTFSSQPASLLQTEDDEQNANIDSPSSIQLEESAFSDISVSDATTTKSTLLSEQSITAIPPMKVVKLSKVSIDDVNKAALEFFNARTSKKPVEAENPDLNFFKSLMPDMAEMNSDQKRRFRIGILTLMQDILSEKTSASTISTVLPNIVGNQQPHPR